MTRFESIVYALLARLRVHHLPRQVPEPPAHPSPGPDSRHPYRVTPTRWGVAEAGGVPCHHFPHLQSPHRPERERLAGSRRNDGRRQSWSRSHRRAETLYRPWPVPRGLLVCKPSGDSGKS